jgi:hypothetical protein
VNERQETLEAFGADTGIHDVTRIVQRGRTPEDATFTIEFADGTSVRVGPVDVLWSQAKLAQVLLVTRGLVPAAVKPNDWRNTMAALIAFATDVEDQPDQTLEATVHDWLQQYAATATRDVDHAAGLRDPYIDRDDDGNELLYIHAGAFLKHIRREHQDNITLGRLREALASLGFDPIKVNYNVRGTGKTRQRTSVRYLRAPLAALDLEPEDDPA